MAQNPNFEDDKIDLGELFSALWSHNLLIVMFTGLFIFLAVNYNLTTQKKFTAKAVFHLEEVNSSPGFSLPKELGALASFAGLAAGGGGEIESTKILLERAVGREFIIKMKDNFSLDLDPYFNAYDPNYKDPAWKVLIKKILGWQKTEQEKSAIVETNIIKKYRKNVEFEETKGGALEISVTHVDPRKASEYANAFMNGLGRLVEDESIAAQGLRLNYLSKTLADALQDMEKAQENLKNYTLKNSAVAQENFLSDSLKLDEFRMEKREAAEFATLLSIIENFIKSGNLDSNSYEALRSSHPLVDDIEFRRVLGMSETISAWIWPEVEMIEAVSATLRDRIKRLDVDIKNIEENAKLYATSAEDLDKFGREAKIAEATYTVLIEQVKSQTLAAGFQPETFKVFEYATPPIEPSSPQRLLVLALGAALGIFTGCFLALSNAKRRGVYYNRSTLLSEIRAELEVKSKSTRKFYGKSISDIISLVSKKRIVALDEAVLKLANKKIIYVLNSGGKATSSNVARLLAIQSAQSGKNVLLCDTTGQLEKEIGNRSDLPIVSVGDNISVMTGADGASFFTSTSFHSTITDLKDRFDQVFVSSSKSNAQLGLMALVEFAFGLVLISGLRKTKKIDIKNIRTEKSIDLLFYE